MRTCAVPKVYTIDLAMRSHASDEGDQLGQRRPAARREKASEVVNLEVVCSAREGGDLDVESRKRIPENTSIRDHALPK